MFPTDLEREAAGILLGDVDMLPLGSVNLQKAGHGYCVAFPKKQARAVDISKGSKVSLFWHNRQHILVQTPTDELERLLDG